MKVEMISNAKQVKCRNEIPEYSYIQVFPDFWIF